MNDSTQEKNDILTDTTIISIIVPAYNEVKVLPEFHKRITKIFKILPYSHEIVYVNDGSTDGTDDLVRKWSHEEAEVAFVDLSRNFGKEIAMSAGLDYAKGDAVIVIDADLQDPPELIPELIDQWKRGYDVVYAQRTKREGESWFKKATALIFYKIMKKVGRVTMPENTGDFRLLSRRAVDALRKLPESHRFMKGLFAWIGFPQKGVLYNRDPRYAGETKWNYWKLWNFAIDGITSYTTMPLKIATYIGVMTALGAFAFGSFIIFKTIVLGDPVAGFPSLMAMVTFLGGVQLVTIGIIGEYLGRMFDETKQRPLYFVKEYKPSVIGDKEHKEQT